MAFFRGPKLLLKFWALKGLFLAHAGAGLHCTVQGHHTAMGRVLRSYALEPSQGLCGSDTCMPILDQKIRYVPTSHPPL